MAPPLAALDAAGMDPLQVGDDLARQRAWAAVLLCWPAALTAGSGVRAYGLRTSSRRCHGCAGTTC